MKRAPKPLHGRKRGLVALGGPLSQQTIYLHEPKSGTTEFTLHGQTGKYVYYECPSYPKKKPRLKWETIR